VIWQVWVTIVLLGSGAAYTAFVPKRAATFSSLVAFGCFAVASFGALGIEVPKSATDAYVATETGAAVLCAMIALVAAIVFMAAVTGQYGSPDRDDIPDAGAVSRNAAGGR
jgi:hypothetical protein